MASEQTDSFLNYLTILSFIVVLTVKNLTGNIFSFSQPVSHSIQVCQLASYAIALSKIE